METPTVMSDVVKIAWITAGAACFSALASAVTVFVLHKLKVEVNGHMRALMSAHEETGRQRGVAEEHERSKNTPE